MVKNRFGNLKEDAAMDKKNQPDMKAFADNMKTRMPLHEKIFLTFRNNALKVLTLRSCCGHPGEPGC